MRITCAVRDYVRRTVLAKVEGELKAAKEAKDAAISARDGKVKAAGELCRKLCAEAQERFVKEAKRKLGLTFIPDLYDWSGVQKGGNSALSVHVDHDDFVETMSSHDDMKASLNPCKARDEFDRIVGEPKRIQDAANAAADRLLFELELGKVARKELDEALKGLEVKL